MPSAIVLTTASKANTTGGTFADTLAVNSGDSLSVANYGDGGARILEMWAIDSDSVAEGRLIFSRPQSTHDQSQGLRFGIPSLVPGGAAVVAAQDILPGGVVVNLFKSDVATIAVTSTAADDVIVSYLVQYDDLPGASGVFISPQQAANLQNSTVGIQVTAVASATPGAYGASRAFNADDARLHANTWYAILGCTFQTPVTTIGLLGPDWGGQRIGMPGSVMEFHTGSYFLDQSIKWGKPMIPCFNSNNVGNVLVTVADGEASTSPKLDFILYELNGAPTPNQ